MQTVLTQLNATPGVLGSLLCDREGRLVAHAFPQLFDPALLQDLAHVVADGTHGLEVAAQRVDALELRYEEARVVLRSCAPGFLLVLCGRAMNRQFLTVAMSVAVSKVERAWQAIAEEPPEVVRLEPEGGPASASPPEGREGLRARLASWFGRKRALPPGDGDDSFTHFDT